MVLFVLFEHAAGYAIFRCLEVEDIGSLLPEVQDAVSDFARFGPTISLEAFSPFKTGANALENINCISEGLMHDDLKVLIANNIPQGKKKAKVVLGVADPKLGSAIQETLDIHCTSGGVVSELLRGIRLYFPKLVSGLTGTATAKAQLGLGHSYSRAKVKFNVHRSDNMIIQSISLLDQLDKDINTFSMRIREWYSYHFPELVKIIPDNFLYAKVVRFIGSRKDLTEDRLDDLEEIVMDSTKCQAIFEAARVSMGMDISPIDLINIERFATRVVELAEYRKELSSYLSSKMTSVAPNLTTLIGETVGARLISHAGSLTSLAKYPASTVQILGAEKALFRALKTRGNTPKYGLIFHSSFIGRAGSKNKGRISRYLANKCSIASRLDCFSELPTAKFGEKLKEQVEERLAFFETGQTPRKNIDVMKLAIEEVKKEKGTESGDEAMEVDIATSSSAKKKKKRKSMDPETDESLPAKKKKKKHTSEEEMIGEELGEILKKTTKFETPSLKKTPKKKKNKHMSEGGMEELAEIETPTPSKSKKKKKAKE